MLYSYVAFLDVLGFKEFLKLDEKNNSEIYKDKVLGAFQELALQDNSNFSIKTISDSIFIRASNNSNLVELLFFIKKVFFSFLKHKIFIRGGLSFGQHFESTTLTYSMALANAYALESKDAVYPRIIIDKNIIEMSRDSSIWSTIIQAKLILLDGDLYQLNILDDSNWLDCYNLAKEMYNENYRFIDATAQVRQKHLWFHEYLYNFCPTNNMETYINQWRQLS